MVEAAMILPLVITGVMAVIYIVISLYTSLCLQSSLHLALRNQCGVLSKTVYREEETSEFQSERKWSGIRPILSMEGEREHRINTLFQMHVIQKEASRSYIIDEAELVRLLHYREEEET